MEEDFAGTCLDMCPEKERKMRERLQDLSVFERLNNDRGTTSPNLAVKKFSRTLSEFNPAEVRPIPVLEHTVAHLLSLLDGDSCSWVGSTSSDATQKAKDPRSDSSTQKAKEPRSDSSTQEASSNPRSTPTQKAGDPRGSFSSIHSFLSDRFRAVVQDLSAQRAHGPRAIAICQKIVRFHIVSEYEAVECAERGDPPPFDAHLNKQQLRNALVTLLGLMMREGGGGGRGPEDGSWRLPATEEAEFCGYHILLAAAACGDEGGAGGGSYGGEELVMWLAHMRPHVRASADVAFARAILRSLRTGNYCRFFRLAREASFLQACLLQMLAPQVRHLALVAMNKSGSKAHGIPLSYLSHLLLIKEPNLKELLASCNLGVESAGKEEPMFMPKTRPFAQESETRSYTEVLDGIARKRPASRSACVSGSAP